MRGVGIPAHVAKNGASVKQSLMRRRVIDSGSASGAGWHLWRSCWLRILARGIPILLLVTCCAAAVGQDLESPSRWQFVKSVDAAQGSGIVAVELDRDTLGNSREDLGDLRLRDADGREVPYALHVRRKVDRREVLTARSFDSATRGETAEITIDLGTTPSSHNEVEVVTVGDSFRRPVRVFGSDAGVNWALLVESEFLFRFQSPGFDVDESSVRYPESRKRFLRVEVDADSANEQEAPSIASVSVRLAVEARARDSEFPLTSNSFQREATREQGRAASKFIIDLGAELPVRGIRLGAINGVFSRPYRLEVPAEMRPRTASTGKLTREAESDEQFVSVEFPEAVVSQLTLIVTDDRNPPLEIAWVSILAAAREVFFDASGGKPPYRLEFGNTTARSPHYDFAASVPTPLDDVQRVTLGRLQPNPAYDPSGAPLSERAPWLAYVALGTACLALFVLLRKVVSS